jgi:hypothetical protein
MRQSFHLFAFSIDKRLFDTEAGRYYTPDIAFPGRKIFLGVREVNVMIPVQVENDRAVYLSQASCMVDQFR